MTRDEIIAREQSDAALDARIEKQLKQCVKCQYCGQTNGTVRRWCDFVSWEGKLRDQGEGPGKCGSFKPRKKLTKKEQVDRAHQALKRSEASSIDNRFRNEDN